MLPDLGLRGCKHCDVSVEQVASIKVVMEEGNADLVPVSWYILNVGMGIHPADAIKLKHLLAKDTVLDGFNLKAVLVHGFELSSVAHQLFLLELRVVSDIR